MNDPQPIDIRRRIRELLSIPDRDRTDAEWDELNELEIRTAPGNRDNGYPSSDRPDAKRPGGFGQGRRQGQHVKKNVGPRQEPRQPMLDNRPDGVRSEGQNRPDGQPRPEGQGRPPKRQHRRPKRPQGDMPPQGAGTPPPPPQGGGGNTTEGNS